MRMTTGFKRVCIKVPPRYGRKEEGSITKDKVSSPPRGWIFRIPKDMIPNPRKMPKGKLEK